MAKIILTLQRLHLNQSCVVIVFLVLCRAFTDRPAAGCVTAGGGAESLPADCGHQPDPGPGCTGGRLHGGAASHGG